MMVCSICARFGPVVHPEATEKHDGCPYRKKSDPTSSVVEVRTRVGRFGFWIYDGAALIEHFDYEGNAKDFAKRFAKVLNKGSVRYVRGAA